MEWSFQGPMVLELVYGGVIHGHSFQHFFTQEKEKRQLAVSFTKRRTVPLSFSFYICSSPNYLSKFQKSQSESEEMPKDSPLFLLYLRKFNLLFIQTFEIFCSPSGLGKDQIPGTGAEVYEEIIFFCQPFQLTTLKVEDLRTFQVH